MKALFADTSFYLALLRRNDNLYGKARLLFENNDRRIVTTDFVIIEMGALLAGAEFRGRFLKFVERTRRDPATTIVPASRELFDSGMALFQERPDKEWSLTDCISMNVMNSFGITEVLTHDKHFEQAQFRALLRD